MKYFLTGGTGFVGNVLAKKLVAQGHQVVALVRNPDKAVNLKSLGAHIVPGDVTDQNSMREAMRGCDGVFHVAGYYKLGPHSTLPAQQINVEGTRYVLELMQELKIPKGVYTSTLAIHSDTHGQIRDESYQFQGRHLSAYDRTKAEAHKIAQEFMAQGLPLVIVMPGLIYGPEGTSMSDEALRLYLKKRLPLISKRSAYSWAHVDDVADGHLLAMENAAPGSTYIIAGPSHTVEEAYQLAYEITGMRKPLAVPPIWLTLTSYLSWLVEKIMPLPDLYSSEGLGVEAGVTYLGDNSKAKIDLGYQPRPLKEGLRQTLAYEMEKLNLKRK